MRRSRSPTPVSMCKMCSSRPVTASVAPVPAGPARQSRISRPLSGVTSPVRGASHMLIFDREPTNWEDLQNLAAQLFSELGCEVVVGGSVELVRGSKEIDVRVRDPHT